MRVIVVPGIDNSGAEHWQSRWQRAWGGGADRIRPASWTRPEIDDWLAALDRAVGTDPATVADATVSAGPVDIVLVAHSLGCLAVARWLREAGRTGAERVRGAFLVAPPDTDGPEFPAAACGFAVADGPIPVPAVMVTSDDDRYCTPAAADRLAAGWAVPRIGVGRLGHLNSASGLGDWPAGRDLFTAFLAGLGLRQPVMVT